MLLFAFYFILLLLASNLLGVYVLLYIFFVVFFKKYIHNSNNVIITPIKLYKIKLMFLVFCKTVELFWHRINVTIPYFLHSWRFIKWRPLFKKTSYFGNYRSNKNRWLNK